MRRNKWILQDGCHQIHDIAPHIDPNILGQYRYKSEGRFCVKHMEDIGGHVVLHKRAMEMINKATTHGLGKNDIQHNSCAAWKFVVEEKCLGLDSDGL